MCDYLAFTMGDLSWEGGGILPHKVIRILWTHKKINYEGKLNRFRGYRDPSQQIDRHTQKDTLLLLLKD